jgi:amino acid efflux transporter
MGTMNVYLGGTAKLIASLAHEGALPRWLGGDSHRSIPRRPLALIAFIGVALLVTLLVGFSNTEQYVRATSACFIAVYVLVLASAARILEGRMRVLALVTLALTVVVAVFSAWYLLVPAAAGAVGLAVRRLSTNGEPVLASPLE